MNDHSNVFDDVPARLILPDLLSPHLTYKKTVDTSVYFQSVPSYSTVNEFMESQTDPSTPLDWLSSFLMRKQAPNPVSFVSKK